MVDGCDATKNHRSRLAKRAIKIRTRNGLNGHNGTHITEFDLGRGWRGLPDAAEAAIVNSYEDWAVADDYGRALVGQPKRGCWFALATPITDFQRQHR